MCSRKTFFNEILVDTYRGLKQAKEDLNKMKLFLSLVRAAFVLVYFQRTPATGTGSSVGRNAASTASMSRDVSRILPKQPPPSAYPS